MPRPTLQRVTGFDDYTCGKELLELLKQAVRPDSKNRSTSSSLADARVSPDGRHVHLILRAPRVGLLTFDRRAQLIQNQKHLDLRVTRTSSILDVVYLDHNNNNNKNNNNTLAVVYENGKAEFWVFQEGRAGWTLLQTSDLCNSPRARVVSVASCSNLIIWCEERPHSGSSPSVGAAARSNFRYCVCQRAYEVQEEAGAVSLGGVKIALHNNPCFTVVSSGEYVYLLPAGPQEKPPLSASQCLLSWSPQRDTFRVSSTCTGTLLSKKDCPSTPKETDFKRLVTDCLGYLSALEPPEIHGFSPAPCGGLLMLLSTGWVTLLQRDGALRHIYRLADDCPSGRSHSSFHAYQDTLALTTGRSLYLIDLRCGRELEKIALKRDALLYVNKAERRAPHLLLDTGLYVVTRQEDEEEEEEEEEESDDARCGDGFDLDARPSFPAAESSAVPGGRLVKSVFEEACKYYQRRSLSSTQLTVDKLKKGGMFQAPISLATILKDYLRDGGRQKAGGESSNGAPPPGAGGDGRDKLLGSLEAELKALVSLEEVKGTLVRAGEKEVDAICESLVQQEVCRLLASSELDGEALLYLNSVFSQFPPQAWRATQAVLQLHCNGSGSLSSRAPPEVWKTVLGPVRSPSPPADLAHANGQPKHRHRLKAVPVLNSGPKTVGPALPVFELLCLAVLRFRADWLPGFLELAHQKQGSGGLASSWSYSSGRGGGENGERAVPLYKRALSVLHGQGPGADREQNLDLEVELLLVSGRPNAVLQALRMLMGRCQWERVTRVAQTFCQQSPLLNKEIFGSLLCEVAQHRDLDPYLDLLWALCPEDLTVTTILNLVLKTVPNPPPFSSSSPFSSPLSSSSPGHPAPFPHPRSTELTVGLLKPLLRKVLQRETKPSQRYADILQSPIFPPPAPPRQPTEKQPAGRQQTGGWRPGAAAQAAPDTDSTHPAGPTTPPPPPLPEHETPPPPSPPEHETPPPPEHETPLVGPLPASLVG